MQLPSGAQTWISCGYDNAWTLLEHLTAAVVDALRAGNWQRSGDSKAKRPDPVKRPSDIRGAKRGHDHNATQAQRFLARKAAREAPREPEEA